MEKVFVVTSSFHDSNTHETNYSVDGVFKTEELARQYVSYAENNFYGSFEIVETEIVEKWK